MTIIGHGKTNVGKKRTNNEDSILVSNENIGILPNLYIVADGMGGHQAGEVASQKAIEYFIEYFKNENHLFTHLSVDLVKAVKYANDKVYILSMENPNQVGMGTTFSACVIEDSSLHFVHVGDSRIYICNKESLTQLSEDHSLVNIMIKEGKITAEEAITHPKRNVLTRALGTEFDLEVDYSLYSIKENDQILICSDGLTNMINNNEIFSILNSDVDTNKKPDNLIDLANANGGTDNISVILLG